MPRAAVRELLDDPEKMALDILHLRAYARAKEALDNAKRPEDKPTGAMVDTVMAIQTEIINEERGE